jgi:hypothetical protein
MRKVLVCLCVCLGVFRAASASAQTLDPEKGWLDVNFGIAKAAEESLGVTGSTTISSEQATFAAAYSFPQGAEFDFGGGYMFSPAIGLGVSISGTAHRDVAGLAIRIPHPLRFNAFATDATATDGELERTEGAFHLQAMIKAPLPTDRVRLRFFTGPSYFRLKADAISNVNYEQLFQVFGPGNTVAITTYQTTEVESTAWGFHAGADAAVMFGRVFGLGGFMRFSRATATVEDAAALGDGPVDVKLGGFQTGGGIRLRF